MKRIFSILFVIIFLMPLSAQEKKGKRILYIGDSITDGNWGKGDGKPSSERNHWDWNHLYGSGYVYLCVANYMGHNPEREYKFFNRGVSGNTLTDLEKRWKEDAIDIKPDLLSVLIGINDANRYVESKDTKPFDFDGWEKLYRALLDSSLKENPKLQIVLCSPFVENAGNMRKKTYFASLDSIVRHLSSIVENIAKDYKAVYLPYQQMFDEYAEKYPSLPDTYWIWDGIHPAPAGHRIMADMWIGKVNMQ